LDALRKQGSRIKDYKHDFDNGGKLKLAVAYQRSKTCISEVNTAPGVLGVSMTDLT